MIQTILSITAISLSSIYLLFFLKSKERSPLSLPLALTAVIMLAALLEFIDFMTLLNTDKLLVWKQFALLIESFIPPAWLWFTLTYARQNEFSSISLLQRILLIFSPLFAVSVLVLPVTSFFYSPDFASEHIFFLGNAGFIFYCLLVIYLVIAMVNLEMTLRTATVISRWKIKFELLGAGSFLAVMIMYYSHGILFRTINMDLVPVRTVFLIAAVAMMTYSRLKRGNGVKVYVSRQVMYKSVVLLMIGLYLMVLGLTGEGMKHFGAGFQQAFMIIISLAVGLGILVVLLSETAKRNLRVLIHKNFYQNKYDYQNQWLQFTDRLSSSMTGDELLNSIVSGFCDTFGMRCGALLLLDQERGIYRQSAEIGIQSGTITFKSGDAAIAYLVEHKWVADLREGNPEFDAGQTSFFKANDLAFLIPLFIKDRIDGFVILGKPLNKDETYNYEDFDLMKTLARQASSTLLNLHLSDQLASAREMEAIGKVSAFVLHDLKNLVSAISLMLENAKDFMAVPEFQNEMLISLGKTVAKMNILITRLKHLPEKISLQRTPVDLLKLAHETASLVMGGEFQVTGSSVIAEVDQNEFQKVALNLMLNAAEASEGKTPVTVEVGGEGAAYFRVRDEGCGISDTFLHNHMFTPFMTTKSKGLGIGLYQCKQIVEAHGGKIEVVSEISKGSQFTVWLPLTNA